MHIQMSSNTNTRAVSLLMKYSRIAGAAAFIGGCVVFAGWIFNIPILMSFQPMSVTMKCNTALAFILTGGCLLLFHRHRKSLANDLMIKVFASVVLILSLLNVAEYISRSDLGIDQVIVYEPPGTPGTYNPGRMAPNTAFCFICLSTALVLVTIRRKRTIMISQIMGLLSLLMTITALIGFLYSINEFYGFDNLTKMAHYAIILFIILDTGVLCAVPDKGIMDIV